MIPGSLNTMMLGEVAAAGPRLNYALPSNGGTATASSTFNTSTHPPSGAINGNRKTNDYGVANGGTWVDLTGTSPQWLQVTFSQSRAIDEINVFTYFSASGEPTLSTVSDFFTNQNFTIEYWTGSAWAVVPGGTVTGNTLAWRQFTFSPITTDRIRVHITQFTNGHASVVELEGWGT